jgi:BolA protein
MGRGRGEYKKAPPLDSGVCPANHLAMNRAETIRRKLEAAFAPERIEIIDESHRHAGHEGARPGGETHFRVTIVSAAFAGQPRLVRQRRVYGALSEEMAGGVHALALRALAPDEDERA